MHVVLVRYGEGDGCGLNDLHAETMFIHTQPVDNRSTIRVILGKVLQFSMRDIIKLFQPRQE